VRDVESEDRRLATVGRAQALENLDRRRLARPVRPQQAEDLARADAEADAVDRYDVAVDLSNVPDTDDRVRRDARRRRSYSRFRR
jgi:hypothetical protein